MMKGHSGDGMKFEVLRAVLAADGASARLGRLSLPRAGVPDVETPGFFSVTSRGAVPHVTPDNLPKARVGGVYMALEDFIEKSQSNPKRAPPIYQTPPARDRPPLHVYTAMPPPTVTVLGPRRFPAVAPPMGNVQNGISIFTSTGFQTLTIDEYEAAAEALRPDIAIPLADLASVPVTPRSKRAQRMAERTEDWLAHWLKRLDASRARGPPNLCVFAPVLPVSHPMQWEHLDRLSEDHAHSISGLAVYDATVLPDLKDYPPLLPLPRLSLDEPATPHDILEQLSLGIDLFLAPFLGTASEAGVALTFAFPAPAPAPIPGPPQPLGVDLSDPAHRTSLAPLRAGCACYACTHHHRAYLHHLLQAREMLAWTLLQLHNHAVLADFFAGVRAALLPPGPPLAAETARFAAAYEPHLPAGTAEPPRARGYHFRSAGRGEPRRNRPAWGSLGAAAAPAEPPLEAAVEALSLAEDAGLPDALQTPLVPDEPSGELGRKGFAEVEGGER